MKFLVKKEKKMKKLFNIGKKYGKINYKNLIVIFEKIFTFMTHIYIYYLNIS